MGELNSFVARCFVLLRYFIIIFALRFNNFFTFSLKPNNNMEKKRILIVTQEMDPYLALTEASKIANELPKFMQEQGLEIRV